MSVVTRLARRRVALGFVFGGVVLWLARPTTTTLLVGGGLAVVGESIRIWASGHLEKGREVTRSGPYRWTRHPLYLGSSIIAVGLAVASAHVVVALVIALYLGLAMSAAIRTEEARLRAIFGAEYEAYREGTAVPMLRRFSLRRMRLNREPRALLGLAVAALLLVLKSAWLRSGH